MPETTTFPNIWTPAGCDLPSPRCRQLRPARSTRSSGEVATLRRREDARRLHGAVDQAGHDRADARDAVQAVAHEMLVLVEVRDDDAQQIVRLAGQQEAVEDLVGVAYAALDARLILLLANQIGDLDVLREALAAARAGL